MPELFGKINMPTAQHKISVIIPTYNRGSFLIDAVKSIQKQKYENIEIIIVDDGSKDNTKEVVTDLQKKYSNIIFCCNNRLKGPSGARNTGIIRSEGEYIAFLDSDDIWLPAHLEKGVEFLNKNKNIGVLFGNFQVFDYFTKKHLYNSFDKLKVLHTLKYSRQILNYKILEDNLFKALIQENFFLLGSIIVRKSVLKGMLLDESTFFAEDRDFAVRLYKEAKAVFACRLDPVYIQYRHDCNLSSSGTAYAWQKTAKAHLYLYKKYLNNYNLLKQEKEILTNLIVKRYLSISNGYRKNSEFKNAFINVKKSFKYRVSLNQVKAVLVIFIACFLFKSRYR